MCIERFMDERVHDIELWRRPSFMRFGRHARRVMRMVSALPEVRTSSYLGVPSRSLE